MANKYLSASLGTRNWNDTTGTWVTSNGGSTPTTAPTTSDIVYMTSLSGNVTCTTASDTAGTLYATGYTGTLTINSSCQLTVVANLTFSATMTMVNNGTFQYMTTSTGSSGALAYSGIDIPGVVRLGTSGNKIWEIGSNLVFLGAVTIDGQNRINNYSGSWGVYFKNGISGAGNIVAGTASIYMQGGKMDIIAATANVYIDGTITVTSNVGTYIYGGFGYVSNDTTLTYLSGSFTNTNTPIKIQGNVTFDTGSDIVFNKLYFVLAADKTYTLSDDLYVNDISVEGANGYKAIINGAYKIKVNGSVKSYTNHAYYGDYFSGNAVFEMIGTGYLGQATSVFGTVSSKTYTYVENPIEINTSGTTYFGNIGLSGSGTLTYITGTIGGSGTILIVGTYSITGTFTIPNLVMGGLDKGISSYNSGPWVLNILTDMTINTLTMNYNSTLNITDTKTITIATIINSRGNWALDNVITSTGTGTITYNGNCNVMNIVYTDMTNITATKPLAIYKGTITNCTNIVNTDLTKLGGNNFTLFN